MYFRSWDCCNLLEKSFTIKMSFNYKESIETFWLLGYEDDILLCFGTSTSKKIISIILYVLVTIYYVLYDINCITSIHINVDCTFDYVWCLSYFCILSLVSSILVYFGSNFYFHFIMIRIISSKDLMTLDNFLKWLCLILLDLNTHKFR